MKFKVLAVSMLILVGLAYGQDEQEKERYLIAGLSNHKEDIDAMVDAGLGWNVGVGVQLNEKFGLEVSLGRAPLLIYELWEAVKEESIQDFDLGSYRDFIPTTRKRRNEAISIAGTRTIPMGDNVSWIFKAGYSYVNYRFDKLTIDAVVEYGTRDTAPVVEVFDIRDKYSEVGHALLIAGGLQFQLKKKWKLEMSASNIFMDEGMQFSLNAMWKYRL